MYNKNILDISLPIKTNMMVYPKNPEVIIEEINTGHSTISKITFGSHTGTHVDAPKHANSEGLPVDQIDLDLMMGPCRVLDCTHCKEKITVEDLKRFGIKEKERILAKTQNSYRGFEEFYEDYIYLEGDAAKYLGDKKISLFGIDYLSIKKRGSEDNRPHTELLKHGIPIFEGLDLSKVKPGEYIFFGLPLRIEDCDGAPARCVLIPN